MQLSLLCTFLPSVALRMTIVILYAFYAVLSVYQSGYVDTQWLLFKRYLLSGYVDMRIRSDKVDTQICSDWVSAYPRIHLFLGVALKWQGIQQFSLLLSGGSRERPPRAPLFLNQTEAQRAEKNCFWDWPPPPPPPPPLTEGLDLPLLFNAIHVSGDLPVNFPIKLIDFHCIEFILLLSWHFCGYRYFDIVTK